MSSSLLFVFFGCVLLSAVLGTLAHSVMSVPRATVEELAERKKKPELSRRLDRILSDAYSHARAVGLLKLASDLVAVIALVGYVAYLRHTGVGSAAANEPHAGADIIDAIIGVSIATAVLWVATVVLPISIAQHAGARVVYSRSLVLRCADAMLYPLRSIGKFSDEVVRRLAGVQKQDAQEQVQAELLSMIEEGEATGALGEREREMLEAVVTFRDLTVQQIMTPRTEIEALQLTNDLGAVIRTIRQLGHSRIPVYDESLDNILGIFYIKDLMHWLGDGPKAGKAFDLKSILRPAIFVPETKTVRELLKELMEKKVHIALVADEYGGTAGLATFEDIVEEVFGEIRDEYEPTTPEAPDVIVNGDNNEADLDAAARIDAVNDQLEVMGVQLPVSEDYDTVGGFVTTTLGRIPARGESFNHENMTFKIVEAKPTRVLKVSMKVAKSEAVGTAEDQSDGA